MTTRNLQKTIRQGDRAPCLIVIIFVALSNCQDLTLGRIGISTMGIFVSNLSVGPMNYQF